MRVINELSNEDLKTWISIDRIENGIMHGKIISPFLETYLIFSSVQEIILYLHDRTIFNKKSVSPVFFYETYHQWVNLADKSNVFLFELRIMYIENMANRGEIIDLFNHKKYSFSNLLELENYLNDFMGIELPTVNYDK